MTLGRTVVVPIANPDAARAHLQVATWVAAREGGLVLPLAVVPTTASDARLSDVVAFAERACHIVAELGGQAQEVVVVDDSVANGVLDTCEDVDATLVVMGWQRRSSTQNVFGALIDTIAGRSRVPLAVVRPGAGVPDRVVLPWSREHTMDRGQRGLAFAADLAKRLTAAARLPALTLHVGDRDAAAPRVLDGLGDERARDHRAIDLAVGAHASARDVIVAPVAPTASGLRTATTHLAWAVPEATLVVAVDVGTPPKGDLAAAVELADVGAMIVLDSDVSADEVSP